MISRTTAPQPLHILRWSSLGLTGLGFIVGYWIASGNVNRRATPSSAAESSAIAVAAEARTSATAPTVHHSHNVLKVERDWRTRLVEPRTPARDREMVKAIEELAARDPQSALDLAAEQANFQLREKLLHAALRGWASVDPAAAAKQALSAPFEQRRQAVEAVLTGASNNPEAAARLAVQIGKEDPFHAGDHGHALIGALVQVGAFEIAAQFAQSGTDHRAEWLNAAFQQWVQYQPDQASVALDRISDPIGRREALHGMVNGWATTDPAALAVYGSKLQPGEDRSLALHEALPRWVSRDPIAAVQWMDRLDLSPDLDRGAAAVATFTPLIASRPEVAAAWAESIVEPTLRSGAIRMLVSEWMQRDHMAARRFLENTAALSASDRTDILREIDRRAAD